jgi:hypothetical protein
MCASSYEICSNWPRQSAHVVLLSTAALAAKKPTLERVFESRGSPQRRGNQSLYISFGYKHSFVTRHYLYFAMSTLQTELDRLYLFNDPDRHDARPQESCLMAPDGRVRAMVLELARPADWSVLSALWRGVQTDLGFPAPAIAVSGIDGYQLWFSLAEPVPVAEACAFLESLRLRYLSTVAPERIGMMPCVDASAPRKAHHARLVPALQQETGHWSAFVAPDLAAIFADEPWLDLPTNPDAQASVLSRHECIKPAAFQAVLERTRPVVRTAISQMESVIGESRGDNDSHDSSGSACQVNRLDPKRFLLDVMSDQTIELHLRIEAAKALLPYFEGPSGS